MPVNRLRFMKHIKLFHQVIYLCAFLFMVLCPAVHHVNDALSHDIVIKNGTGMRQKTKRKNAANHPIRILNTYPAAFNRPAMPAARHTDIPLPVTSFNLSVLSSIRLNV
jgi:hypothetical protein